MELESRSPCHQDILYHMFIHETIYALSALKRPLRISKLGRFYVVPDVKTRRETWDDLVVFLADRGVFSVFTGDI